MNPFDVLGVQTNCTIEVAKAQYRKLASTHHPDKGGDTKRFQEIQVAWTKIEQGYRHVVREEPVQSSFGPRPGAAPNTPPKQPYGKRAGDPAPGYEARGRPPMPRTRTRNDPPRSKVIELLIEITEDQAFEGCTVPFVHDGKMYDYVVRPGATSRSEVESFPYEEQIGLDRGRFSVRIELKVLNQRSASPEKTRDAEMDLPLCALALFTGGRVSVKDHLGASLTITIQPGQDPDHVFKFPGHGYGNIGNRGTLLVKIKPVFKAPNTLNAHELAQLKRLNEMTI